MIALIILVSICIPVVLWYKMYYNFVNNLRGLPKPKRFFPIIGNLLEVTSPTNAYFDLHRVIVEQSNYKSVRGVVGWYAGIMTADPELIEFVMTHPDIIDKAFLYNFLKPWLGTGLLTSGGSKWRVRRKLLTPAYHFKILGQFIDVFDKNGSILVKLLKQKVNDDAIDIYPYISRCALDIICESAMGTKINAQINSNSEYVRAVKDISQVLLNRGISVFKQLDFLFKLTNDYKKHQKALHILHHYTLSVIETRRKELINRKNMNINTDEEDIGEKKKIPFLDLLLQATLEGEVLSDEDIREEVDTFMFEGHDTVSSAISFTLYCLAKNPEIQENVLNEQREIYGDEPNRETTINDLNQMKYLEMVIKEALRLYPSVPLYGRVVMRDIQYQNCTFKKGMQIGMSAYTMHRNPEIYPDPERFDPLRFTPEMQSKRHPSAYLPFSAGFRNCIGQKFAILEMKSTVSKLIRNYIVRNAIGHELQLKSGLVLTSLHGVNIKLQERQW